MYENEQAAFARLLQIMDELREGCPWDRKQTLDSLRHLTLEEVYELSDAILQRDLPELKGELGDLLLHIVFYARIAREQEAFTIESVIHQVCDKLVRRHPHIYGEVQATDAEAVAQNWEAIKQQEKGAGQERRSVLAGVPESLPSLLKAYRIQEKVSGVGFDWPDASQVIEKVQEELEELKQAHQQREAADATTRSQRHAALEGEFGDLLFSLVNYARFLELNPVDALDRTNAKFRERFQAIERAAEAEGRDLKDLSLREMEAHWQTAKTAAQPDNPQE
jgi:XTP/dITP diphosphohydrolase